METHLVRRQAVNLAFRHGDALEDRHGLLFHPVGKPALGDQLPDLSEGAAMLMRVGRLMRVGVAMGVRVVLVVMIAGEVHVELHAFQARLAARAVTCR